MPARNKNKNIFSKLFVIGVLVFAFVFLYIVLTVYTSNSVWENNSKFSMAIPLESGDALVLVLDPATQSLIKLTIPKNTAVEAARQLGSWKMGSIYTLDQHENQNGQLFKDTITKSFNFPIDGWGEEKALALVSQNPLTSFKGLLGNYNSDLSIKDKLKLIAYSLTKSNIKKVDLNLEDTSNLIKSTLADGESGFVPKKQLSPQVLSYFTDSEIAEKSPRIQIVNYSNTNRISEEVAQTIKVLGGNVLSILNRSENRDFKCEITGLDKLMIKKIAQVYNCNLSQKSTQNNFDVMIELGSEFAKVY